MGLFNRRKKDEPKDQSAPGIPWNIRLGNQVDRPDRFNNAQHQMYEKYLITNLFNGREIWIATKIAENESLHYSRREEDVEGFSSMTGRSPEEARAIIETAVAFYGP
jgi:hypothetical protein